jgi:hypothetical protein
MKMCIKRREVKDLGYNVSVLLCRKVHFTFCCEMWLDDTHVTTHMNSGLQVH